MKETDLQTDVATLRQLAYADPFDKIEFARRLTLVLEQVCRRFPTLLYSTNDVRALAHALEDKGAVAAQALFVEKKPLYSK